MTKEVWANGTGVGTQHIDRQVFDLPSAFDTQTLLSIRLIDNGADYTQRLFIAAATVAAVPEPETYAMMLAGLVVIGAVATRGKP